METEADILGQALRRRTVLRAKDARAKGISATTPQADATAEGDAPLASRLVLLFYLAYDAQC